MIFNKFQKISISFFLVIFLFSIFYFLFSTDKVLAAGASGSWPSPTIELTYPWSEADNPADLIAQFYQIALGLAAAAAFGVLIYGAILWTLSGAVTSKEDAKEWIFGAVWGLVLLLGAYLILYTINPDLVNLGKTEETIEGLIPPITPSTPPPATSTTVLPILP